MVFFLNIPVFIASIIMAIFCVMERNGFWDFAGFWVGLILMTLAGKDAIQKINEYRATKRADRRL